MINLPKLILASGSPRRAEILTSVGWEFEKRVADIDEAELENEKPDDYVQRLAREKAEKIAEKYKNTLILGADTIVVINNKIIGKPKDLEDAGRMLKMLSGSWHEVLTGVAIVKVTGKDLQTKIGLRKTQVKFARMSDAEINFLVENGSPLDKAGAYAVQAQAALFIEEIKGDYWNVVGLPINLVYEIINSF